MARKNTKLSVVPSRIADDFSDLLDDVVYEELEDDILDGVLVEKVEEIVGISLDDAISETKRLVGDAVDFMNSTLVPEWEAAQEFFDGETDLKIVKGRSRATITVVRDTIRALKPSAMRIFSTSTSLVEFLPANPMNFAAAAIAEAQTRYAHQIFWRAGGYMTLQNNVHNTLLKKVGIMKASFSRRASDEYVELSNLLPEDLQQLTQMPDVRVLEVEDDGVSGLKHCKIAYRREQGIPVVSDVSLFNFFVDDAATCVHDATVIGERQSVTVGYARELGLEYDGDWLELSDLDPELDDGGSGESHARRGYTKNMELSNSADVSLHRFLLTEAYVHFDLDGTGIPQLYRFWLGGNEYEYIHHERVDDNPYAVCQADPMPDSFFGRSVYDNLAEDQNVQTSAIRATLDNAHLSNNRRLAVHDVLVNMQDVMNPVLGAPIRFKTPGMIQEIGVQSTVGAMLPLLQHLRQGTEIKAGITNAAAGLDPDALQSTDKEAVKNTIMMQQGQVELACRNIGETGIRTIFVKLLKLTLRHNPRKQLMMVNGQQMMIDPTIFDPELTMEVRVGTGNNSPEMQLAALGQIAAKQEQMITQFGLNNPICSINHMLNTIVDMGTLMGIRNMGRYFNNIDQNMAQQLQGILDQKAAAAQQEPPSKAIIIAEQARAAASIEKQKLENSENDKNRQQSTINKMVELMMRDDLERDRLAQNLAVEQARITGEQVDKAFVQFEQGKAREHDMNKQIIGAAVKNQALEAQKEAREQAQQLQQQQAQGQPPQGGPQGQ